MADLLDIAAPRPLDMSHQGIAACLAVLSCAHTRFPADQTVLDTLRDILPHAHGDGVTAQALVQGAQRMLAAYARDSVEWRDWYEADEAAHYAVRLYYRQRAAHSHAKIFPETQTHEAAHAQG